MINADELPGHQKSEAAAFVVRPRRQSKAAPKSSPFTNAPIQGEPKHSQDDVTRPRSTIILRRAAAPALSYTALGFHSFSLTYFPWA
jgi:hypothetical protein